MTSNPHQCASGRFYFPYGNCIQIDSLWDGFVSYADGWDESGELCPGLLLFVKFLSHVLRRLEKSFVRDEN